MFWLQWRHGSVATLKSETDVLVRVVGLWMIAMRSKENWQCHEIRNRSTHTSTSMFENRGNEWKRSGWRREPNEFQLISMLSTFIDETDKCAQSFNSFVVHRMSCDDVLTKQSHSTHSFQRNLAFKLIKTESTIFSTCVQHFLGTSDVISQSITTCVQKYRKWLNCY